MSTSKFAAAHARAVVRSAAIRQSGNVSFENVSDPIWRRRGQVNQGILPEADA
jgi:hypothetical protein